MHTQTNNIDPKNFILNHFEVKKAMISKGFDSIESLASELGVHRNTIIPYLSGKRALPDCLDRLLKILDLSPARAIIENINFKQQYGLKIAPLISELSIYMPVNAYVLFGSRAKGTSRKYSDYDVGVFNSKGLSLYEFSPLIDLSEKWEMDKEYDVNLSNLTLADENFLREISSHWIFLGGNFSAWIDLQTKSGTDLYE